jgi:hypothetical protein
VSSFFSINAGRSILDAPANLVKEPRCEVKGVVNFLPNVSPFPRESKAFLCVLCGRSSRTLRLKAFAVCMVEKPLIAKFAKRIRKAREQFKFGVSEFA